jgi:hypothetical protein
VITRKRGARCETIAVDDDLLTDDSQLTERGAQRREVGTELFEAQVPVGSAEDLAVREVGPEFAVVLGGDRLVADADQIAAQGLSEMKPGILPPAVQEWMVTAYPSGSANTKVRPNGPSKGSVTIRTPA